jgi:hypothetical protein
MTSQNEVHVEGKIRLNVKHPEMESRHFVVSDPVSGSIPGAAHWDSLRKGGPIIEVDTEGTGDNTGKSGTVETLHICISQGSDTRPRCPEQQRVTEAQHVRHG